MNPENVTRKLFFSGEFPLLDKNDPEGSLREDYRALILGDVRRLLYLPEKSGEVQLSDKVSYVGPFYFYGDSLSSQQIVSVENDMIQRCTDAVFLLENNSCPGSVTELVNATLRGKTIHIYYVVLSSETPETEINSDQWYPMAFASMVGKNVTCTECGSRSEAIQKILSFVDALK